MNFAKTLAAALIVLICVLPPGLAAASCQSLSMQAERQKLASFLTRGGMDSKQMGFLTSGAVKRANELSATGFNERGKACGVAYVRASVIGCLNAMTAGKKLSQIETGKPSWGKSNLTRGEMLVVGYFHSCRGGAMEAFYAR